MWRLLKRGVAVLAGALLFTLSAVAPAMGQAVGTQHRVSSGPGIYADVAHNSQANQYLVVWQGLVGGSLEILGRLVDGAGSPVGTEFRISYMGADGDTQFTGMTPAVAYNAQANEFLVVWEGTDTQHEGEIHGQRLTAAGAATGSDFRISAMGPDANAGYRAVWPAIAYNTQANEYLVTWHAQDDAVGLSPHEREVYGQRLTAAGAATGTDDFRISAVGTDGQHAFNPAFAAVEYNAQANEYLVTWQANESTAANGPEWEIYGQRLTPAGAATGADDFRISTMGPEGDGLVGGYFPAVASSAQGEYLVTWYGGESASETGIFGQRLTAGGAAAGLDDFRIAAGPHALPAVAYNAQADEYLVTWQGTGGPRLAAGETEILGQRLTALGVATGTDDFRISAMGPEGNTDYFGEESAVAAGAQADEYLVAWWGEHEADNAYGIFAGYLGPDADGDGSPDAQDCDDANASIRPGATDVPENGVDEDCAGGDAQFPDADGGTPPPDPGAGVPPASPPGAIPPGPTPNLPLPRGPTNGNDQLTGSAAGEKICGLLGNDLIKAGAGNDTVFGDACGVRSDAPAGGGDTLYGGPGKDILYGGGGPDKLYGDAGTDKLYGGAGNDQLSGGKGNDTLTGGPGVNTFKGGAGNDRINARNGKRERIDCGAGRKDSAIVDKADRVRGCEKVTRSRG